MLYLVTQFKNNTNRDIRTSYSTSLIEERVNSHDGEKANLFEQPAQLPDSSVVDYKFLDKSFDNYTYFFNNVEKNILPNKEKNIAYNIIFEQNKKCIEENQMTSLMRNAFIFLKKNEILEIDNTPILLHDLKNGIKTVKYQAYIDKEIVKNILQNSCYKFPKSINSFNLWNGEVKSDTLDIDIDIH